MRDLEEEIQELVNKFIKEKVDGLKETEEYWSSVANDALDKIKAMRPMFIDSDSGEIGFFLMPVIDADSGQWIELKLRDIILEGTSLKVIGDDEDARQIRRNTAKQLRSIAEEIENTT